MENEIKEFLNDFPYNITIKKEFNSNQNYSMFNGKNMKNLGKFNILRDEDLINTLLDKIKENNWYINLILNQN